MKLWRNHYAVQGESKGYSWHRTRRDALLVAKQQDSGSVEVDTETIEIAVCKAGIMRALTLYATYPNNG